MAEGYAHVSGKPGVAMVTSGPAATNLVTPLMDAYMDSVPMVAITGQVPTAAIGSDVFQECDTVGITRSCTKHNELIMTADDIPMAVRQAFHIATTGRPGPTLIDVPKDVLQNEMDWHWPTDQEVLDSLPGYRPNVKGHPRMIKEAARLILASERPIIYAGGGILKARAAEPLRELAELIDSYVVTTLMARGAFPDNHPLCLGMPGMHGNATAVTAMQKADLLITLGAPLRRPHHGQGRCVRPAGQGDPCRHRSCRAGQGPPARRADRRRCQVCDPGDHRGDQVADRRRHDPSRHLGLEEQGLGLARAVPGGLRPVRARRCAQAPVLHRGTEPLGNTAHDRRIRRGSAPDVHLTVLRVQRALHLGQLRRFGHDGLLDPGGDRGQGSAAQTATCGPSTATAVSR